MDASIDAVSGWKFFSDENHWTNGFWEQKITQLSNLKKSDFSSETLEKLSDQTLTTLGKAGERFTQQYENSKVNSMNSLGLKENVALNIQNSKNLAQYSDNFQSFQNNLKQTAESVSSASSALIKNGASAIEKLNDIKDSGVMLFTKEIESNDFI